MEFNVEIKKCNPKSCPDGYQELWIDGEWVMESDTCHDKIGIAISSFLNGLTFCGNNLNITINEIPCKFEC